MLSIFFGILGLAVGFVVGYLVTRNNLKRLTELEQELIKVINGKKLTKDELINLIRDKLNI